MKNTEDDKSEESNITQLRIHKQAKPDYLLYPQGRIHISTGKSEDFDSDIEVPDKSANLQLNHVLYAAGGSIAANGVAYTSLFSCFYSCGRRVILSPIKRLRSGASLSGISAQLVAIGGYN